MANSLYSLNTKLSYLSSTILKSSTPNSSLFRAFCSTTSTSDNQQNVRKMEVFSLEPMNSTQKAYLRELFELNYLGEAQSLEVDWLTKKYLGPNELEIYIDKKKMRSVPKLYEIIGGVASDSRYTSPPGKPKGAEARLFSNQNSPVYEGVARRLGYKPLKGFQHP
ncbi:hypothetical protein ACQ4LE_003665 [Meloidogyne hapla]|uniref:Lipoxygenase domain-containing protein n=1 Tax=Meloidogyne hapla TaxID=6305 RepID=A0A1I8BTK1_MELHA